MCNLGNGNGNGSGFSVREVIETVRKVTGREVPEIVVDCARTAHEKLGRTPTRSDLTGIVTDSWNFARREPS